jgi:hypothetical protein
MDSRTRRTAMARPLFLYRRSTTTRRVSKIVIAPITAVLRTRSQSRLRHKYLKHFNTSANSYSPAAVIDSEPESGGHGRNHLGRIKDQRGKQSDCDDV